LNEIQLLSTTIDVLPAESACKLVAIFLGAIMAPVLLANLIFSLKYPESRYAWKAQVNGFMSIARPQSALKSLDGIRSLSTMYIVIYHTGWLAATMTSENGGTQNEVYMAEMWPLHEMSPFFFNGAQAVDAFFVMSGFLATLTTLKKMQRINWSEQNLWFKVRFWFTYVLNRYLRLLPMVLVAAWFSWMIWPVLYRGPNSLCTAGGAVPDCNSCKDNWYYFLGMFWNLYPTDQGASSFPCLPWTWYIANDFQFYLLVPFILILYLQRKWLGFLLAIFLVLLSWGINFGFYYHFGSTVYGSWVGGIVQGTFCITPPESFSETQLADWPFFKSGCSTGEMVKDSYGKPWYRMGTFFLGTIFALPYESLKKFKPHRLVSFVLSFFAFIWILFGLWYAMWLPQIYNWKNNPRNPENHASQKTQEECEVDHPADACFPKEIFSYNYIYRWPHGAEAFYNSTFRLVFGSSVLTLIALMELRNIFGKNLINQIVRAFLSCRIFAMFSKLSYLVYLYHCMFIVVFYATLIPAPLVAQPLIWQAYTATLLQTILTAIGVTFVFDLPISAFTRFIISKVNPKPKEDNFTKI